MVCSGKVCLSQREVKEEQEACLGHTVEFEQELGPQQCPKIPRPRPVLGPQKQGWASLNLRPSMQEHLRE